MEGKLEVAQKTGVICNYQIPKGQCKDIVHCLVFTLCTW